MRKILKDKRIVICAGKGGVGKTTMAASLGFLSASQGYKTFVLTIDPSYRLKTALDFQEDADKKELSGLETKAPLFVSVLSPETVFENFLKKHCKNKKSYETLKNNSIYKELSTRLGFYQEFTALVEIYEAFQSDEFDRIILDTPPGPQFMKFLEGTETLGPLFDKAILKWLMKPRKKGFLDNFLFQGPVLFLKFIKKFIGADFLETLYEFMTELNQLKEPIYECLSRIQDILNSPQTAYIGITGGDGKIFDIQRDYDALIFNRLTPFKPSLSIKEFTYELEKLNPPISQALKEDFQEKYEFLFQKQKKYASLYKDKKEVYFMYEEEDEVNKKDFLQKIINQWE